jgi:post-GPI attachment to proteins factor 2
MKKRKMLPAYQQLKENGIDDRGPLFTISFGKFSLITVSLPLFSFIFCVSYSLIFFFEQSTSTHCHVWNYLPSISVSATFFFLQKVSVTNGFFAVVQAAIGSFQPQAIVWQISIIVHFIPRLVITWMYKRCVKVDRQMQFY